MVNWILFVATQVIHIAVLVLIYIAMRSIDKRLGISAPDTADDVPKKTRHQTKTHSVLSPYKDDKRMGR